jgi:AraC family transcriptional regulator
VARAREYLENNWREEFNIDSIAKAACLSPSHLVRLFKKHTGMTPYSYYQEIKVSRLKEALRDKNVSISQAFLSCGFEYPGNFARFFKEQVGMTPSQYRKSID